MIYIKNDEDGGTGSYFSDFEGVNEKSQFFQKKLC